MQSPSAYFSAVALFAVIALCFIANPAYSAPEVKKPACAATSEFVAVDLSLPVSSIRATADESGLDALRRFGVTTVFRYYDMPSETIACKTLLPEEADSIAAKGMKIGVVFQHNSDDPATFVVDTDAGKAHALRALELAASNGQPLNTAIYFGIDGADLHLQELASMYTQRQGKPLTPEEENQFRAAGKRKMAYWYKRFRTYRNEAFGSDARIRAESFYPFVKRYLQAVRSVFDNHARSHGGKTYKIGLYCTGGICDYAERNSLADYYWVTAEGRNLPEYSRFVDRGRWSLLQQRETSCPDWLTKGVSFDFNRVAAGADIGTWSPEPSRRVAVARPSTCPAR